MQVPVSMSCSLPAKKMFCMSCLQDEEDVWQENPFELDASQDAKGGSEAGSQSKLAEIDAKLEAFQAEGLWNQPQEFMSSRYGTDCGILKQHKSKVCYCGMGHVENG